MPQTLTRLLVHVVFSTKERRNLIHPAIETDLYAYFGGICRNKESPALAIGGTENHVHLLISLSKNIALSDFMMALKKDASKVCDAFQGRGGAGLKSGGVPVRRDLPPATVWQAFSLRSWPPILSRIGFCVTDPYELECSP